MGISVLLDTHVLLWALLSPEHLSSKARHLIEDSNTHLIVSSVSAWEIATKYRIGRLPEATALVQAYKKHLTTLQASELTISTEHALLAGQFHVDHRDPFDRMLAAQSQIEGVSLVTSDHAFDAFEISTVW